MVRELVTAERLVCAVDATLRVRASSDAPSMRPTVPSLACASASWFTLRALPSFDSCAAPSELKAWPMP